MPSVLVGIMDQVGERAGERRLPTEEYLSRNRPERLHVKARQDKDAVSRKDGVWWVGERDRDGRVLGGKEGHSKTPNGTIPQES